MFGVGSLIRVRSGFIVWLFLFGFILKLCSHAQLTVLPLILTDYGLTSFSIGVVAAAYAVGVTFGKSLVGIYYNVLGDRAVCLGAALLIALASLALTATRNIWLLSIARLVFGLGVAAMSVAYFSIVSARSTASQVATDLAYMSLLWPLSQALGSPLGGLLLEHYNANFLFLSSFLVAVASLALISRRPTQYRAPPLHVPPETNPTPESKSQLQQHCDENDRNQCASLSVCPKVDLNLTLFGFAGAAFGLVSLYMPILLRGISPSTNPGYYYSIVAVVNCASRLLLASYFPGRTGSFILTALFMYVITFLLLSVTDTAELCLFAAITHGIAAGIIFPNLIARITETTSPTLNARKIGFGMALFEAGAGMGSLIFGALGRYFQVQTCLLFGTIIIQLGLVIEIIYRNRSRSSIQPIVSSGSSG
jgi:MFS family permease